MEYIDLLGVELKNEILLDLFETYDADVIYQYDRLNENTADTYWATITEMGLEFVFSKDQRLITLFMSPVEHSGFNPFTGIDPRSVEFASGAAAMQYANRKSINAVHCEAKHDQVFGAIPEWVKFDYGSFSIHYQFNNDVLELVTLEAKNA